MDDEQSDFIKDFQNILIQMEDYVKNAGANPKASGIMPIFTPSVMLYTVRN